MSDNGTSQDYRKYDRKKLQGVAFATLYRGKEMILGQLLDISPGGLAMKYLPPDSEDLFHDPNIEGTEFKADVYLQDQELFVEGVQCKLVYNQEHPKEHPMCMLHLNKCAVQFQALNAEQHAKLLQITGEEGSEEEGGKV